MNLSQRIRNVRASSTVAFATKASEMRRQGVDVIAMTAGEPDFQPPEHVFAAAREATAYLVELGHRRIALDHGHLEAG